MTEGKARCRTNRQPFTLTPGPRRVIQCYAAPVGFYEIPVVDLGGRIVAYPAGAIAPLPDRCPLTDVSPRAWAEALWRYPAARAALLGGAS